MKKQIFFIACCATMFSCEKEELGKPPFEPYIYETNTPGQILPYSATLSARYNNNPDYPLTEIGFILSEGEINSVGDGQKLLVDDSTRERLSNGHDRGFVYHTTGLKKLHPYNVRMFASTAESTVIGNQVSFTTANTNEWIKISEHPFGTFQPLYRQNAVGANGKCYIAKNTLDHTGPEIKIEESEFFEYDPITGYLNGNTAKFPSVRRSIPARFSIGNKIFICPGTALRDDKDTTYYRTIWAYDTDADAWAKLSDYPGPKLYSTRAFVIGTKAYLLGSSSFFWEYDSEQDSWKELSPVPTSPGRIMMAVAINGKGYFVFSRLSEKNEVWEYVPETDQWNRLEDLIIEVLATVNTNNAVISFSASGKGYFLSDLDGTLYEYDPVNKVWRGRQIITGRYEHGTAVSDIIYVFNTNSFDPHSVYAMVPE